MNESWWERPACYICDYWWAMLLLLVLALTAWFTRSYWLPAPVPVSSTPTRVTQLGTGDVQITLIWNSTNDLDLWVQDPNGVNIYYRQPSSQSGGQLDVDANAGCRNVTTQPVENIFWPFGKAPPGEYVVWVNYYQQCEINASTPFTVRISVDGRRREFSGVLESQGETKLIEEFNR